MPSQQPTSELTTRDVLLQVDRRLTLIEEDVRSLDEKMDARFRISEEKTDARFRAMDTRFSSLDTKIDAGVNDLRREMNTRFYWLIGLFFAGWLSMIGTILFKS